MLTITHPNNQSLPLKTKQNVNFMSEKSLANRMLDAYSRSVDRYRYKLISKNKNRNGELQEWRFIYLCLSCIMAFIVGVITSQELKQANTRFVEVQETEVLHEKEKALDEKYKKGILLFEEYVHELKNLKSDYESLEADTRKKLDEAVQSRVKHSYLESIYNKNPETGKYDYEISLDYENKVAKVNILDCSNTLNDTIPKQIENN